MDAEYEYEYRAASREEWQDAMALAWRVFLKFVAHDYTETGVRSFQNFVTDNTIYRMFLIGSYQLFGAYDKGKLIGMISLRGTEHISLLFVDEKYQNLGVGKALVRYAGDYVAGEFRGSRMTVNAAPGAVGFYHRIGFTDTDEERFADGIRYVPMQISLS